jgi:hypothetical protein
MPKLHYKWSQEKQPKKKQPEDKVTEMWFES